MTVIVERALTYAEKDGFRHLQFDLYRPEGVGRPLPLLHYVHGGGWRVSSRQRAPRETRAWSPTMFEQLALAGFVVAASDYRFSGEARYPAAIEDTIDALSFLRSNAGRFGIDAGRSVLFGQSAGGYLAAAVGLRRDIAPVDGVVCWYPLTDFSTLADDDPAGDFPSQWLGGPLSTLPDLVERSRLPLQAHAGAPPFLLVHGTADTMAPFDQSVRLGDALAAAGTTAELVAVDGADHFFAGADDAQVREIFSRTIAFAKHCVS